jgi:hypothetical protein
MDPDSKEYYDLEKTILKQRTYGVSNDSNVFQSIWIRRLIQTSNEFNSFVLDNRRVILFRISSVFLFILLFFKKSK